MRIHLIRSRPTREQDGAAAVEMALLLPLLVLLVYGVIEFGIIFAQDLGMGNGAREGARYAATGNTIACNDGASDDVIRRTRQSSETVLLDPNDIEVDVYVGPDEGAAMAAGAVCTETGGSSDSACEDADDDDRVFVVTRWQRGLSIPFGPVDSAFEVNGRGVFKCEYR